MGQEQRVRTARRQVRKVISGDVAVNVLELHRFLRRGFFGRLKWLVFGL